MTDNFLISVMDDDESWVRALESLDRKNAVFSLAESFLSLEALANSDQPIHCRESLRKHGVTVPEPAFISPCR
jgi:hypothetical protein